MGLLDLFKIKLAVKKAAEKDSSILDAIVVKYGEVLTDKDEPILFDGDVLKENMPVFTVSPASPDPVPVVTGTYTLKDGGVIEVVDGVVIKITPAEAKPADGEPAPTKPVEAAAPVAKQTIERHEIESYFKEAIKPFETKISDLESENIKLKATVEKLGLEESAAAVKGALALGAEPKKELTMVQKLALINKNAFKN